jgi:transcriptional regulator with XRE-family HTH domain
LTAPGWQAREALATRLKELRAGRKQAEFAQLLGAGWDQSKVSLFEAAAEKKKSKVRIPSRADLEALATATGADLHELERMRIRAETERDLMVAFADQFPQTGGAAQYQAAIAAAEQAAKRLAFYYPWLLPGVLQTADWAREMLSLNGGPASHGASEDDVRSMIAARLRRAALLREPGRQIIVLTGEGALRTRVASPETMQAQCEHIAALAASPATTATIGIVPFSAQLPFAAVSAWEILDDTVLIETEIEGVPVADPAQVAQFWQYTQDLLDVALTGPDAAALCRRIAAEYAAS